MTSSASSPSKLQRLLETLRHLSGAVGRSHRDSDPDIRPYVAM
jgi:hypothetical protein